MTRLRPVGVGCATSLVLASLARIFPGPYSEIAILASGLFGGFVTAIVARSEGDTTWRSNAHNGLLASGLGGIVIFAFLLVSASAGQSISPLTDAHGDFVLFLTMSPMVIPVFATLGAVGGVTETGVHAVVTSLRY